MKIFIAGEGNNELGGRSGLAQYQTDDPGVIEALLKKVRPSGWRIVGALQWKDIPKYKTGGHRKADHRSVLGLCKKAADLGVDVLAFVLDRDAKDHREQAVMKALEEIPELIPNAPKIIGGMAVEKIEAWILALRHQHHSEAHTHPEEKIGALGTDLKKSAQYSECVEKADLEKIPKDAKYLLAWIARAKEVLNHTEHQENNPVSDLIF